MADRSWTDEGTWRAALREPPGRRGPHGRDTDAAERLQSEAAERLLEHLEPVRIRPDWVIAAGGGTAFERGVAARFPKARIAFCRFPLGSPRGPCGPQYRRRVSALSTSPRLLPFLANSAGLVASSLVLHWFPDPIDVLREMHRVLSPGGLAAFGTFGPDTLHELRESWARVDDRSHMVDLIDMHEIGDEMIRAGFTDVVMDSERITVTWTDIWALLRDLRALGTGNPASGRPRGLTTPARLAALARAYDSHRVRDRVPATVEFVHGHGWKRAGGIDVKLER